MRWRLAYHPKGIPVFLASGNWSEAATVLGHKLLEE